METAIISIVCIALIVLGGMTMSQGFLSSVDSTTTSLVEMSEQAGEIARTELSPVGAQMLSSSLLELVLSNSGQTKLNDFDKWDFIIQYYDSSSNYYVKWLPYVEGSLGDDQWTREGIYLDAAEGTPEVFEPRILNPGEEVKFRAKLNPAPGSGTVGLVVMGTPNGVPVELSFNGYSP